MSGGAPAIHAMPTAAIDAPLPAVRWGWFSPVHTLKYFGHDPAGRQRRSRWIKSLRESSPGLCQRRGTALWVRGDAVLPDGRRVADAVAPPVRLPADVVRGRERVRRKQLAAVEAARRYRAAGSFSAFILQDKAFLAENGLPLHRNSWCGRDGLLDRIARGEPVDGRSRSGRKPMPADERLNEAVRAYWLHPNRLDGTHVYEEQRRIARELGVTALTRSQVRKAIRAIPHKAAVLAREGPKAFAAKCIPKVTVDYSGLSAGEMVCIDGRVPDRHVRIPDGRGGWRAMRPFVTGAVCVASGAMVVDVRTSEATEGRLAILKRWCVEHGVPAVVQDDNAEASKAAFGARRGSRWQRAIATDDSLLRSATAELGIELKRALPYTPWSKKVESLWRLVKKHSDRLCGEFWGGSPGERPEEAAKRLRTRPDSLPTLEEYRGLLQAAVDTYNATPRRALGGLTPTLAYEQRRAARRTLDPDTAHAVFTKIDEHPRKVGRDGVSYRNILYTLSARDSVALEGRKVYVRPDIDLCGRIWLCDEAGQRLAIAEKARLVQAGATPDELRDVMREKAAVRRLAKEYLPKRNVLLAEPESLLQQKRRAHALAEQEALRAQLPPAPEPTVTIVRPDLAGQVRSAKARGPRNDVRRPAGSGQPADGFELLAARQGDAPIAAADRGRSALDAAMQRLVEQGEAEAIAYAARQEAATPDYWAQLAARQEAGLADAG